MGALWAGGGHCGQKGQRVPRPEAGKAHLVPSPGLAWMLVFASTGESPWPPPKDHRTLTEASLLSPPRPWDTCPCPALLLPHCPRAPRGGRLCHPAPSRWVGTHQQTGSPAPFCRSRPRARPRPAPRPLRAVLCLHMPGAPGAPGAAAPGRLQGQAPGRAVSVSGKGEKEGRAGGSTCWRPPASRISRARGTCGFDPAPARPGDASPGEAGSAHGRRIAPAPLLLRVETDARESSCRRRRTR